MNNKPNRPQHLLGTAAALIFVALLGLALLCDGADVDAILAVFG